MDLMDLMDLMDFMDIMDFMDRIPYGFGLNLDLGTCRKWVMDGFGL